MRVAEMRKIILVWLIASLFPLSSLHGQSDKREIRAGNRAFKRGDYNKSLIDYKRALTKDSLSVVAGYNTGNLLFKMGGAKEAEEIGSKYVELAGEEGLQSAFYHNMGNYALTQKGYKEAIEHYKNSLRRNPNDYETKSNLAYAQKMLEEEQQQDQQDQKDNQQQDQDDNKKDDKKREGEDKREDKSEKEQPQQEQEQSLTPQGALQLLKAIENKDKETQEKVNREKVLKMEKQKREKNW